MLHRAPTGLRFAVNGSPELSGAIDRRAAPSDDQRVFRRLSATLATVMPLNAGAGLSDAGGKIIG